MENSSVRLQTEARLRCREGRINDGIKVPITIILQPRVQATYVASILICVLK